MNLRSNGSSSLAPRVEDPAALEREIVRRRREEEQQAHFQRLGFEMDDNRNLPHDGAGNGQGADNLRPQRQPVHQQRPARPIGTYDRPNINGHRLGIRAPAVEANNFEIKPGLLNVIENNKYHGLAVEDPFDHLDKFDSYCGLSKTNGVSEDAFKLKLFPFSLGDKARQWEKSLPSDSITTWEDCKRAFLEKFFSSSRTAKLRNEISSFQQTNLETFSEAWERFRSYQAQCPHHGFSKESLLSTFYRGALPKYRARLDTASNGFFLGRTEEDAEELVDNMVKSNSVYSEEYDRSNRTDDEQTRMKLKSLQAKLDMLISEKAKKEQLNSVGDQKQKQLAEVNKVAGFEGQEELCFINNNGTWYRKEPNFQYNNYQQRPYSTNQQGGYQPQQNPPPGFQSKGHQSSQQQSTPSTSTPQESSTDALLKQILESQTRSEKHVGYELKNLHTKIDGNYSDLNNKFLQLASHFQALESQVANMSSSSKSPKGSLPGKSEQNPKESCNVVISATSSEIELSDHVKEVDEIEKLLYGTEFVARADSKIVIEAPVLKRETPRAEKPVERRAAPKLKEEKLEDATIEPPPYEVPLPFPKRFLTKAQKKVITKFRKDLSDVGIRLPELSTMHEAHVQMMLIQDILTHQEEVAELLNISTLKLDPPIPPKSLPKLGHQGMFTLPCSLGQLTLKDALVDSGASVNVISLEMMKSLGIESMEPDTSSLQFGDSSSTTPLGIIKDFPLKIGSCTIPIDLTVLKMANGKRIPLLLGTPFLTTVGACIDFPNKKVTLMNVNKAVSYPLQPPLNASYCGTMTYVEEAAEKSQEEVVVCEKECLAGDTSKELCVGHFESSTKEGVSGASKATHGKKKMQHEPHPPPLDMLPHTITLHPMKLKDGVIEYKLKSKGNSRHFSSARAIITPQLQDDPVKLQELLSHVLTITLEGGKDPPSH